MFFLVIKHVLSSFLVEKDIFCVVPRKGIIAGPIFHIKMWGRGRAGEGGVVMIKICN